MVMKSGDRVLETTETTGTGTYTLLGAADGAHLAFEDELSSADTCWYCAWDDSDFEIGKGTFTISGADRLLARTTVLRSSNADAAVSWTSGTRNVALVVPEHTLADLVADDAANGLLAQSAANTFVRRSIQDGTGIAWTNRDGVAGNPQANFTPGLPVPEASGGTGESSYTKGDLLAGDAGSGLGKLAVGANDQVPIADSAEALGVRWGNVVKFTIASETSNFSVVNGDDHTWFRCAGTCTTVTLPAAPDDGLAVGFVNDHVASDVTIDGNGKNITGAATLVIEGRYRATMLIYSSTAGEWFRFYNLPSPSYSYSNYTVFTASQADWPVPAGYDRIKFHGVGAGGGGGEGGRHTSGGGGGGGGGAGAYTSEEIETNPGALYDITVGTGGAGGTSGAEDGNAGSSGGSTSIAPDGGSAICTAAGGAGGSPGTGTSPGAGGAAGVAWGGDINYSGGAGGAGAGYGGGGGGGGGAGAAGSTQRFGSPYPLDGSDAPGSAVVGGAGGEGSGGAAGGAGGNGAVGSAGTDETPITDTNIEGAGGGGGGSGNSGTFAYAGGAGGSYGAGGGGGGGCDCSSFSGGDGGAGIGGFAVLEW